MKKKEQMTLTSEKVLRASMKSRIRKIASLPLMISVSVVRTERKCGSKTCKCANGRPKHPFGSFFVQQLRTAVIRTLGEKFFSRFRVCWLTG